MAEIIKFPKPIRPPTEIAYDLETVSIIGEIIEDVMEDRGYELDPTMFNDIKVLTNLAYAAVRRQASKTELHPFHEMMEEMSDVIDTAVKMVREESKTEPANDK